MKKYLSLIFLLTFFSSFAQRIYHPFPTDSAQWSEWYYSYNGNIIWSRQFKIRGDTALNGKIYHKIYTSKDIDYFNSITDTIHCFVREDSGRKVWVKYPVAITPDTNEFLLYDFNLVPGDTFHIHILFKDSLGLVNKTTTIDSIVIQDTSFGATNVDTREEYGWKAITTSWIWGDLCDFGGWRQGIGDTRFPFYCEIPLGDCLSGNDYVLECFWQKGTYITGGTFCDYTDIKDPAHPATIHKVVPNPVSNISQILHSIGDKIAIIYDMLGKQLRVINRFDNWVIERNEFVPGVYLVEIISNNNEIYFSKFLIP